MKKNIPLIFLSFIFFMTDHLQAQGECSQDPCYVINCCIKDTKFYAGIFGGANFLQNTTIDDNKSTYEAGYVISGCLGYCLQYGLRVEGEYAYRRNDINKIHFFGQGSSQYGHFQTSSYMANLLWNLPLSAWGCSFCDIQPFIGAGIGYDFQQMHSSNSRIVFNQKWSQFSFQLMTGLVYPIFCNTEIALEYKFHQGGCHFYNHYVGVGLTYKFGRW